MFSLFLQLARTSGGNLICSPYSVRAALSMLAEGARGRTADEIRAVIGAGAQPLKTQEDVELTSATSLWGQEGMTWEPAFLEGADLHEVDYAKTEEARRLINAWASERTHDRIPEILADGTLNADSRLTLVNALYFKASWQKQFEEPATAPGEFHRLDGSTVETPLMSAENGFAYASGDAWVAVDIPYRGGEVAMAVVVPSDYAAFEAGLTEEFLPDLLEAFHPEKVRVRLPRWTTRFRADLERPLAALGITTAFTPGADFSGMTTQERLHVSAAVHEGFIEVDEAGTEAAAVTAFAMRLTSAPSEPPRAVVADRPFLYVIHDRSGTPLFVGRLLDPTD